MQVSIESTRRPLVNAQEVLIVAVFSQGLKYANEKQGSCFNKLD